MKADNHRGAKSAAIWLRVSTSEQTTDNQRKPLEDLAASRGLKVVKTYDLEGKSAFKGDHQTGIEEALRDARAGVFNYFIIWSLDRLSRQGALAMLEIGKSFSDAKVKMVSLSEPWLEDGSSDMQPVLVAMWAQMAHNESKHKGERVKAARHRLLSEGKWPGGKLPYGYGRAGSLKLPIEKSVPGRFGSVEVFEPEAKVVRLIFSLYTEQRLGVHSLAKRLSEEGLGQWRTGSVWRILKYDYRGGQHHRHEAVSIPRIVDPAIWERSQRLLEANKRRKPTPSSKSPLQGRVKCASPCEGNWRIAPARPDKHQKAKLYCTHREAPRPGSGKTYDRCVIPRLTLKEVTTRILNSLRKEFRDHDTRIALFERTQAHLEAQISQFEIEAPDVERRVQEIERMKARLTHAFEKDGITVEQYDLKIAAHNTEIARLEASVPRYPERQGQLEELRGLRQGIVDLLHNLRRRKAMGIPVNEFSFLPELGISDELIAFSESALYPLNSRGKSEDEQLANIIDHMDISITVDTEKMLIEGQLPGSVVGIDSPHASLSGRGLG